MMGPYRIARLLGIGGMGRVYKGVQPQIGSRVAVKVLSRECTDRKDLVERFFSEARAVNLIRHENIVNVLDLSTLPDGRPYIVMEYLDGASLSDLVSRLGAMPLGGVARLAVEVLDALAAAHAKGIVHRDLKPDNVFVTPVGRAKVLDFGIAKLLPELGGSFTQTGSLLGTPHYMSPEQASGKAVDFRTDLYAMGVILFECATGHKPFYGDSMFDLLRKHVDMPPPSPRGIRADLPPAYEQVILTALAKDPNHRFASASAMAVALQHASSGMAPDQWAVISGAAAGVAPGTPSGAGWGTPASWGGAARATPEGSAPAPLPAPPPSGYPAPPFATPGPQPGPPMHPPMHPGAVGPGGPPQGFYSPQHPTTAAVGQVLSPGKRGNKAVYWVLGAVAVGGLAAVALVAGGKSSAAPRDGAAQGSSASGEPDAAAAAGSPWGTADTTNEVGEAGKAGTANAAGEAGTEDEAGTAGSGKAAEVAEKPAGPSGGQAGEVAGAAPGAADPPPAGEAKPGQGDAPAANGERAAGESDGLAELAELQQLMKGLPPAQRALVQGQLRLVEQQLAVLPAAQRAMILSQLRASMQLAKPPVEPGQVEADDPPTVPELYAPLPPSWNGKRFDVSAYLPTAVAAVRKISPDAQLFRIDAEGVLPDGMVDLSMGSARYGFFSKARAARPKDVPLGAKWNPSCQINVWVDASGIDVREFTGCKETPVPMPRCSLKQRWQQAIAKGAPRSNAIAELGYRAGVINGKPIWFFDIDDVFDDGPSPDVCP
ncbi:MAG: protein kinase [Myxococcales bacterium]|nr:protein kinase [Myxococcales bacterium]